MGDPRPVRRLVSALATAVCRECGHGLIPVEPDQDTHPMCDKTGRVWWADDDRAAWVAARHDRSTTGDKT